MGYNSETICSYFKIINRVTINNYIKKFLLDYGLKHYHYLSKDEEDMYILPDDLGMKFCRVHRISVLKGKSKRSKAI